MGFRFRRSIKIAPGIRLNLNAKSTSVRIGPRGLGYTISSTGKKHVSAGIPGTGLYYSETLAPARKSMSGRPEPKMDALAPVEEEKKTPSGLSIVLTVAAILFGVAWCSGRVSTPTHSVQSTPHLSENIEVSQISQTANPPSASVANVSTAPQTASTSAVTLYTTAAVRLRSGQSTDSAAILTVPKGSEVRSSRAEGQWHLVTYDDRTGWIRGDYLSNQRLTERETMTTRPAPLVTMPAPQARQPVRRPQSNGYITGPRGGCYYYTAGGNKQYVDRSLCR